MHRDPSKQSARDHQPRQQPPRQQPPGQQPPGQATAYTRPPDDMPARAAARYIPPGTRAELVIRRGPGTGTRYRLPTEQASTLGRSANCAITLDHVSASRHHADIHYQQGRFILTDTGSLNGTYLNRAPVTTAVIADGDDLAIGVYRLTVAIHHNT